MENQLRENRTAASSAAGIASVTDSLRGRAGGASIRLLLVDDNADDRAIAVRELSREFSDIAITEISSASELEAVFSNGAGFDLIVTDFQLFWGDGITVIENAKSRWPDMPVIMCTGTGSEEVAVRAMKAGVYDYILKSPRQQGRLGAAVRGALEKREHHRELSAAETRYTTLFDTVPVGLFRSTPQGALLDVNPAFAAILETERDALIGRSFAELHSEPDGFQTWRDQLEREGSVAWIESRFITSTGEIRWVEIHAKALRDPLNGEIIYEGSVEDVTRSKEAEDEREELILKLQHALSKVRTLTGLLPICSSCKKIRDDGGRWNMLESFIEDHSHAHFTHSFCPECARRLYPEVFLDTPRI